ncbi:MAG TPA: hypothetical protein VFJ17_00650 [Mycobacteriales bacterium]|nr:hypothetical protein [Mycobacteriales bacterium]
MLAYLAFALTACSGSSAPVANRHLVRPSSPAGSLGASGPSESDEVARTQATLALQLKSLCPHENAGSPQAIWCEDNDGHTALARIYKSHDEFLSDLAKNPPPARVEHRLVYGPTWLVITNAAAFATRVAAVTHGRIGVPS